MIKRGEPPAVHGVELGAGRVEEFHDLGESPHRRAVERRAPLLRLGAGDRCTGGCQQLDRLMISFSVLLRPVMSSSRALTLAAIITAVTPLRVAALAFAPFSSSSLITATSAAFAARISGVVPLPSTPSPPRSSFVR